MTSDTGDKPSNSDSHGDLHGLNDDPELADDSITAFGKYNVDGDELVDEAPAEHPAGWARFAELIPARLRPEVTMFAAIDAEKSGGTDGAVQVNGLRPDERRIALDVTGSVKPKTLDRAMLHEYAHLLTLRDGQVDPNEDFDEVFAEWILETKEPSGDSIVDQKLRFFDDYPELVAFRDQFSSPRPAEGSQSPLPAPREGQIGTPRDFERGN